MNTWHHHPHHHNQSMITTDNIIAITIEYSTTQNQPTNQPTATNQPIKETRSMKQKIHHQTHLHILSATYGPSEHRKLLDGTLVDYTKKESHVPYTRDVLPFVRATVMTTAACGGNVGNVVVVGSSGGEGGDFNSMEGCGNYFVNQDSCTTIHRDGGFFPNQGSTGARNNDDGKRSRSSLSFDHDGNHSIIDNINNNSSSSTNNGNASNNFNNNSNVIIMHSNTNAYPLMDGKSMNAVFGDPCPGTTKLLRLEYMFQDYFYVDVDDDEDENGGSVERGEQHHDCNEANHVKDDPSSAMETSSLVKGEALDSTISNGVNQSTQLQSQSQAQAQTLNGEIITATRGKKRPKIHCTTSRLFQSTFAEHERVLLKRQDPLFRLMNPDGMGTNDDDKDEEQNQHQIDQLSEATLNGSMHSNCNGLSTQSAKQSPVLEASPAQLQCVNSQSQNIISTPLVPPTPSPLTPLGIISSSSPSKQWRLAPTISEITLPIILPFLAVRQRGLCQLVCSSWRDIVMERGIAVVVDVNDVGLFPKHDLSYSCPAVDVSAAHGNDSGVSIGDGGGNGGDNNSSSNNQQRTSLFASLSNSPAAISTANLSNGNGTANNSTTSPTQNNPSRALLRGLLTHSHSSLESLVLNDFLPLRPPIDLHPNLPFLRKLKRLDISRIPSITDDTLDLISTYIGERLEVLYMKGLRNVSNEGVVRLVQSCQNLRVLDVSLLHQLDDEAGIAIGRYLRKLEVLHGRDNYRWTNKSVDVITRNCRKLVQVTIWGCIRLTRVDFHGGQNLVDEGINDEMMASLPSKLPSLPTQLVLLNLWGCHNLTDDTASLMTSLPHLRSLCVSECHRLTDRFVLSISQSLPRLVHLQLRYVRRITDVSIDAIACRMTWLHSLDVSFCTKLTIRGLAQLLQTKCDSLAELRLYSCRQLDLEGRSAVNGGRGGNVGGMVGGGCRLVQALQSVRDQSILSFLDLRECQQHEPFARDDLFLSGMTELGFSEPMNGIFVKKAQWNSRVIEQLGELAAKLV